MCVCAAVPLRLSRCLLSWLHKCHGATVCCFVAYKKSCTVLRSTLDYTFCVWTLHGVRTEALDGRVASEECLIRTILRLIARMNGIGEIGSSDSNEDEEVQVSSLIYAMGPGLREAFQIIHVIRGRSGEV